MMPLLRRVSALSLAFLFLLLFERQLPPAQAFVGYLDTSNRWRKWDLISAAPLPSTNVLNPKSKAVRYFLSSDAYSASNRTAELNAARACFDQWQAVPGSILRFEEGGLMSGAVDVNTEDNTNVVFWARNSTIVNGGMDNIFNLTGLTFIDHFSDNTLAEADIVLNGVQFSWFTDFNDSNNQGFFVEAVLLHEIGHLLGLAHSPVGCATMFPRGSRGVSVQAGLSVDEIAAVHALYPASGVSASLANLTGRVTMGTAGVFGAIVAAEDAAGNIAAGTVSNSDGTYELPALVPGNYQVRVSSVDPANASFFLLRGTDVSPTWAAAQFGFAASTNVPVTLKAGTSPTLNFTVSGTSGPRISRLRPAVADPAIFIATDYATAIPAGMSDFVIGVYSTDTFSTNAVLRVTGDGVTLGNTSINPTPIPGLPLQALSVPVHLAPNATPGMRSLVIQQGGSWSYANGFLEISTAFPDYNFDGLDDEFQRQYFARWTAPEAAPAADPDGDDFSNQDEFLYGTDPTDPSSFPKVQSVRLDASGATVTWPSAPGKRYQVYSRPQLDSVRGWQAIGAPVTSAGNVTNFLDTTATNGWRFYRVQAIP
jgi:hypothetical protein